MDEQGRAKPTIPEVLPLLREFAQAPGNEVGGVLHIVLDDGNVHDEDVRYCIEEADAQGDELGSTLGRVLLRMSKTQRAKLSSMFYDAR
jgi:hypothetical protein